MVHRTSRECREMRRRPCGPQPGEQFADHQKADPTQDDQPHDGEIDQWIGLIADQAIRKQGEAGVAEGGDGMENRVVDALDEAQIGHEGDRPAAAPRSPRW